MKKSALAFAIMCDSNYLSDWEYQVVKFLLKNEKISLVLIIRNSTSKEPLWFRLRKIKLKRIFYLLYDKFLFHPSCNRKVDVSSLFNSKPSISCAVTLKGKFSQYFKKEDIDFIKSKQIDFILRFGFNIMRGEILNAAKFGVWSFHHGDPHKYRGAPPGFWEIYHRDYTNGAILQRLTDTLDSGIVLKQGYCKTGLRSWKRNVNDLYYSCAEWPALVCKDILMGNADYMVTNPIRSEAPILLPPTNGRFLFFIFKMLYTQACKVWAHFFTREIWNTGIIESPIQTCLEDHYRPTIKFIKTRPTNVFYADPFGFEYLGMKYVLQEKFDFNKNIGRIVSTTVKESDGIEFENAIPGDGHQSYPYIFLDDNEWYCLPETKGQRKLNLFQFISGQWKLKSTVMEDVPVVDPSIVKYDEKYWIFFSRSDNNSDANLYIVYSSSLLGPWCEHESNPVKIDIRSSRPGGTFFWNEGQLYRPAQNCSKSYGGSIFINRVVVLNERQYKEETVKELLPWSEYYTDGIHTLSVIGNETLVDCKKIQMR